ncbi:MAG: CHAT domain-containing protein [Polyangiales bacterium]
MCVPSDSAPYFVVRIEQPHDVANGGHVAIIRETSDDESARVHPVVRHQGEKLHDELYKSQGLRQLLDAVATGSGPLTIFVRLFSSASPPWELVYHPTQQFLSLDAKDRWPIVRVAGTHPTRRPDVIALPLRVAIVLGAAQLDANGQWTDLYDALVASGIAFEIHVFVAQGDLLAAIRAVADRRVHAEVVPSSTGALMGRLAEVRPHVLHAFAHGFESGSSYLQIATPLGYDGSPEYQIYVGATDLGTLSRSLSLVVLNACRGAAGNGQVESLAFELVCKHGIPATIGMRNIIDASDAHRFAKAFYVDAFERLASSAIDGKARSVPWAYSIRKGREALCSKHVGPAQAIAEANAEWTLPVLFVCDPELTLRLAVPVTPLSAEEQVRLATERKVLSAALDAGLEEEAPPAVVTVLRSRISEIEAQLGT